MKKIRNSFIMFVLLFALVSCASTGKLTQTGADQDFINNWYKVLYSEAMVVDGSMITLGTMYKVGKLSESNKTKAVAAHVQFKLAFDNAIAKLILYYNTPTSISKSEANNACINVQVQTAVITAISFIEK